MSYRSQRGFTLIELILFIIVSGLLASTLSIAFIESLQKLSTIRQEVIALQTAKQCMEWFIGQNNLNGYTSLTCPSTPSPSLCRAPSDYSISNSITCTTLNSDSNYKTITVTVSGLGDATLTTLIAATT